MGPTSLMTPTSDTPSSIRDLETNQCKTLRRRDAFIALGLLIASILVTYDAWTDIFRLGMADEELSYVFLAPVVIVWLMWIRRPTLWCCHIRHGWVGILIMLGGWLSYWYGFNADPVLWRAGAVVLAVGSVVTVVGGEALVKLAPAFFACVFLIPILPNGRYRLAIPLQTATAQVTEFICDVFGMTVDRSGNLLSINGIDVTIAEACNGMRMVLALFIVCYVVAFTMPLRAYVRVGFLIASPLVAIICNVARLVPTVWMFGHRSNAAAEAFHSASGWVMSIVAFLALLGFCWVLERIAGPVVSKKRASA
jgi:exosortase